MHITFSREAGCWVFSCIWGCAGFDFESEQEASTAFLHHRCGRGS